MRFTDRRRLVVYIEAAVHAELLAEGKRRGLTLCEIARERLTPATLPALAPQEPAKPRSRRPKALAGMADVPRILERPGACPHHKRAGELCYKCDPKMGFPLLIWSRR